MNAHLIAKLDSTASLVLQAPETRLPAGFPSPAQDYSAVDIDLNDILFHDRAAT